MSTAEHTWPAPAPSARRVGLSRELVVDAAIELTQKHGLNNWTIQALADELGVVKSVIYHYHPSKEVLIDAVVQAVTAKLLPPSSDLSWKEWYRKLMIQSRKLFLQYPGISAQFIEAKLPPSILPLVTTGVSKLQEAGFGEYTAIAHTIILNAGTMITASHEAHTGLAKKWSLPSRLDRLASIEGVSPGMDYLMNELYLPITGGESSDEEARKRAENLSYRCFELLIDSVLEGLEVLVLKKGKRG